MNNGGFLGVNKQNDLTVGMNNPDKDYLYHSDDYVPNTHVWSVSSAGTAYIYTPLPLVSYPLTILVWLKLVNNGTSARTVVFNDSSYNNITWYLTWNNFFACANTSVGHSTFTAAVNNWHCYVTVQTEINSCSGYVDGQSQPNLGSTGTQSTGGVAAGMFSIGSRAGVTPFNGYIAAYAIWDKVLTSGEIHDIYNNGQPTRNLNRNFGNYQSAENLKGWWLPCDAVWNGSYFEVYNRSNYGGSMGKSYNMTSGQLITTNLP
ncbi:MAG: LamG domain-containing protein [Candidatus Riesia sp.]|nr:LamG domain-containing protein [Candidatus Riesia sp.]